MYIPTHFHRDYSIVKLKSGNKTKKIADFFLMENIWKHEIRRVSQYKEPL